MSNEYLAKLANPAPLGLLGFGITTVLLNLVNAGVIPLDTVVLAMGIAYGGIAQIIVGAMEYQKRQHFRHCSFSVLRLVLVESSDDSGASKVS